VFIILRFPVVCKNSVMSSIDPMECLFIQKILCKLWFSITIFEISEMFLEFYIKMSASLCTILSIKS
jgi:hypothetical protein